MKVCILGCTGMLGSMVLNFLSRVDYGFSIVATYRETHQKIRSVDFRCFDVEDFNEEDLIKILHGADYIINCIGYIKQHMKKDNINGTIKAIKINSLFPNILSKVVSDGKIIQIATDCVYNGDKGQYAETSQYNAQDIYGISKNLGEVKQDKFFNLRCSIVGLQPNKSLSLLDWLYNHTENNTVHGFTNHQWNGITVYHFAKICLGIILNNATLPKIQHIVPGSFVTKYELLKIAAKVFGREDLNILPFAANENLDMRLITNNIKTNNLIWVNAGYNTPPSVSRMMEEFYIYYKKNMLAN
jgi:dTDP-4-dehydrorhamnose reductase